MAVNKSQMRPLVTVAGTPIPDPSEYNSTSSTIVDSARNVEGKMIGSVIRSGVRKVEMTWKYISSEDWANILQLFDESYGGHFINEVTFFNQTLNDWDTAEMYCSDLTSSMFLRRADGSVRGYTGPRVALVET